MDSLFAYYKSKEVKEVEVAKEVEVVKEVEVAKEVEVVKEVKKSWADLEDEEDEAKEKEAKEKEAKDMVKTELMSYRDVVSPTAASNISKKEEVVMKVSDSDEWETIPEENSYITVSKKSSSKNQLDVIYTLEEFIECIKEKKKPNLDFTIHDSAHCPHTFEGSLCKDVRRCKKIHIQRCTSGEACKNKKCPFLHRFDMPDVESKKLFTSTMAMYNKIKPKKQVRSA